MNQHSDSDLQKQSTKHLNVSLKNRMGTESHGGDGGLLEDREDGGDTVTRTHRAESGFSPGGGRRAGGAGCGGIAAAPSEEEKRREEEKMSGGT